MKPLAVIARWTLWQRRWSTMWWAVGVVLFVVMILAFYPPFRSQAGHLDKIITQQVPAGARSFIADTSNWFTPVGYLSSQLFYLVLPMLLGILAIGLGSSLIAREEQEGTVELLLARPLSRFQLVTGKVLTGSLVVTLMGLLSFISCFVMVKLVHLPVGGKSLGLATLSCLLLSLSFGAIAFLITAFGKARVASIGIAALVGLGGYIINSLSGTAKVLKWPAKFMPYHYYEPSNLLNGKFRWQDFTVFAGIMVVCYILAIIAFRRRDIV